MMARSFMPTVVRFISSQVAANSTIATKNSKTR
jgi:hypothetical protein